MRKITRPGQAAIQAADKDDAIDVEGADAETSAVPRAAGGLRKLFQLPAAANGDCRGHGQRQRPSQRRTEGEPTGEGRRRERREVGELGRGVPRVAHRAAAPAARTTRSANDADDSSRRTIRPGTASACRTEAERAITMEWVETTGRTIAEALDAALDELGVDEDDVEYEVLEEPKSGFLGPDRQQRRPHPRAGEADLAGEAGRATAPARAAVRRVLAGVGVATAGTVAATVAGATRPRPRRPASGPRVVAAATAAEAVRRAGAVGAAGVAVAVPAGPTAPAGTTHGPEQPPEPDETRDQQQGSTVDTTEHDVPIEEQAEAAEVFTQGLVDTFQLGARAKSVIDDDVVVVDVTGDNLGLLVGPKGATLHAIEELVRTVVQRQTDGHGVRIHVDVAGYRAKRREALADFTRVARREGARDRSRRRRSSRCRPATARSSTTPRRRSTASRPRPRARTRAGASCCARPDPGRARPMTGLAEILEDARSLGLLGPGPVDRQLGHATDLAARDRSVRRSLPRPRKRWRAARAGAGRGVPGFDGACCSTPSSAAASSCGMRSRGSVSAHRVEVVVGRAEVLARSAALRATFDLVVARSFGAPAVTAECAVGFLRPGGSLVVTEPPDSTRPDRPVAGRRAGTTRARARRSRSGTDETGAVRIESLERRRTSGGPVATGSRPSARSGRATATVPRGTVSSQRSRLSRMFHVEHP